ncbi:hypothetical protein FJZ41_01540 [Candidatus Shapirobacteria bacterium]|nr:hypothetical protein [Candidatus Shapirobacteria bacterium]
MSSEIPNVVTLILGAIEKAKKGNLMPSQKNALRVIENTLTRKKLEELSDEDSEILVTTFNFVKNDVLFKARKPIEALLNDLDGKDSAYFNEER